MRRIAAEPISAAAFAPFGTLVEPRGEARIINEGYCRRFHDLVPLDIAEGRAGVSLFDAVPRSLPLRLDLVERHPLGSQSFLPMGLAPFLVVVAPDDGGRPATPRAFVTRPGQGVTLARGTWHGVLTPLAAPGLFWVVDRIGEGANLQEHRFAEPFEVYR